MLEGLEYLHHPLRAARSERYVRSSLDMLEEIQRTGDIFFPSNWTGGLLASHNSPAAAQTVKGFLDAQKNYPPRLRQVIEQQAHQLFRASRIVGS